MVDDILFHNFLLVGLLWLCLILYGVRLWSRPATCQSTPKLKPAKPTQKRSREPTPIPGLTHKPHCAACEICGRVPATNGSLFQPCPEPPYWVNQPVISPQIPHSPGFSGNALIPSRCS
jgi:hypothetical protein